MPLARLWAVRTIFRRLTFHVWISGHSRRPLEEHMRKPASRRRDRAAHPSRSLSPVNRVSQFESLEERRLLAAFAHINFQPAGASLFTGYLVDAGLAYADRGNGF